MKQSVNRIRASCIRPALATLLLMPLSAFAQDPDAPFAAERRGKVERARWEVVYDFADHLREAKRVSDTGFAAQSERVDGISRTGIFQHPVPPGQPVAQMTFGPIALPQVAPDEKQILHFFTAMSERFDPSEFPAYDGVVFSVQLNGETIFRKDHTAQDWYEWAHDLTSHAGHEVTVSFLVDPKAGTNVDWAFWGRPRVLIEGRKAKMKQGPQISMLEIDRLRQEPLPERVLEVAETSAGIAVTAVMDRGLDLPAQLRDTAAEAGAPKVDLPPALVVGEGPDPGNHTVVRVLNRYHIPECQFLAYPPEVKGGVQVCVGDFGDGEPLIATAPISDPNVREIRLYNRHGLLVRSFEPSRGVGAPYAIAVGRFTKGAETDEIAVVSRIPGNESWWGDDSIRWQVYRTNSADASICVFSSLYEPEVNQDLGGSPVAVALAARPGREGSDTLLLARPSPVTYYEITPPAPLVPLEVREVRPTGVYPSVFGGLWAALPDKDLSRVQVVRPDGVGETLDIGARENRFWFQWYGKPEEETDVPADGRYIRSSRYAHLRTDNVSTGMRDGYLRPDGTDWTGPDFMDYVARRIGNYDSDPPTVWEPCFTHRQGHGAFDNWAEHIDPETGMPKFTMLTRSNKTAVYGEFDTIAFYASTYAFGLPAIESLYVQPLRVFLQELAVPFRANPEHMVGLEPNHEHEIAVGQEGTKGDYNPHMIAGYFQYLRAVYGEDLVHIQQTLGAPFDTHFDAPRDWERGDWDTYEPSNPFFTNWIGYQRYIVNRRLAQTFREALLAGFPPEIIKSHQIPDTYAIGNLDAFSDVVDRYTPIDYGMNTGTGYGFTRYTVWYEDRYNVMQGAWSSGFDNVLIGEYQALTPDADEAYGQLRYIFDTGGYSAHCMYWPEGYDKGFNKTMAQALRRLIEEDPPRPGVTGGVGQIVPVVQDDKRYNIAQIGTGPDRTGLLKSVNEDGTWEGSVYVTPFHAHVDVQAIAGTPGEDGAITFGPLTGLDSGHQIDLTFTAEANAPADLRIEVLRGGQTLPGLTATVPIAPGARPCRYTLRCQLPVEDVTLRIVPAEGVVLRDAEAVRFTEQTTKLTKGILEGRRHRGGVTFDVL